MIQTVNIADLAGHVRGLTKDRKRAGIQAMRTALLQRGRVIIREEIDATKPHPPFDRGEYARSWRVINIPNGVRIYSTSPYAAVINGGRRPGKLPNIQALIGWAKRHGIGEVVFSDKETSYRRQFMKTARALGSFAAAMAKAGLKERKAKQGEQAVLSAAFAIAMSIKKNGIPAKHVFDRASQRLVDICRAAFHTGVSGAEGNVA